MKRLFDLLVSTILLISVIPILLIVSLLIKKDSPGPLIYLSPRMGRGGKQFGLFRFRTMEQIYDAVDNKTERKLTRIGAIIRSYGLDDIPNLFNVLKGDLSLIGPRPAEPHIVELTHSEWQQILSVRPGLFSYSIWALAREFNASDQALKRKLELEYVQKQSFWFDLQLLSRWIKKLIASKGNVKARGDSSFDG